MYSPFRALRGPVLAAVKRALVPVLYRHPPIGLQPERLYTWLDVLAKTRDVPGSVLEIGCSVGGTAVTSYHFMRRQADGRPYQCVDTFSGFPLDQFEEDVLLGDDPRNRDMFRGNSLELVRAILRYHRADGIELTRGDIARLAEDRLPATVSAALIDVDLAVPVEAALERLWPRLAPGGILLVDDCPEVCDWQARVGAERFFRRHGLQPTWRCNMAVVHRPRTVSQPGIESASEGTERDASC